MALWRFTPVADADDPQWLDFERWSEVVVRADSLGMALTVATHGLGDAEHPPGNESPSGSTGIGNEKLYRVDRVGSEDLIGLDVASDGPAEVVRAVRGSEVLPASPAGDVLGS